MEKDYGFGPNRYIPIYIDGWGEIIEAYRGIDGNPGFIAREIWSD